MPRAGTEKRCAREPGEAVVATFKRGAVQNFRTQLEDCRKHTLRIRWETGDCPLKGNFTHLLSVPATAPSRFSSVYDQRLVVPFPTAQPVALLSHDLLTTLSVRGEIRILVLRQLDGEIYCLGISG